MALVLPNITDPVWDEFAKGCRVVALSGNGDPHTQLREAWDASPDAGTRFIPIQNPSGQFVRIGICVNGVRSTAIGAWYRGTSNDLASIKSHIEKATNAQDKENALATLRGTLVYLTIVCDASGHASGMRIFSDTETAFALINGTPPAYFGGHDLFKSRFRDGDEMLNVNADTHSDLGKLCEFWPIPFSTKYALEFQFVAGVDVEHFELAATNLTAKQALSSTWDFGPLYNVLNSSMYLLPGIFPNLTANPNDPQGSFGRFLGLQAFKNGDLKVDLEAATPYPGPLLYSEDIYTVLGLVFGERDVKMPSLSLESDPQKGFFPSIPGVHNVMSNATNIAYKAFAPQWLEHTILGKTLYATDYWLGRFVLQSGDFSNFAQAAKHLFDQVHSDQSTGSSGEYYCIVPGRLRDEWGKTNNSIYCRVKEMTMYVCGWTCFDEPTQSPTSQRPNDLRTKPGRVAALLTKHYDDIAQWWPIYERLRQITALLFCMVELRNRGFKPNHTLQARITSHIDRIKKIQPLEPRERIVTWKLRPPVL